MDNVITPYDLGNFETVDNCQKLSVDVLVKEAKKVLKKELVRSQIDALGLTIKLTTSKTRFNGERLWFACPLCNQRVGTLLYSAIQNLSGCRTCLKLQYQRQGVSNKI